MPNVLVYQQGGTLTLDEKLDAQPSAVTVSLRTLGNESLTTLGTGFVDVTDAAATAETLSLTLAATNEGAREVTVSATSGTPTSGMLDPGYRLLLTSSQGRQDWVRPDGRTIDGSDVTKLYLDSKLKFDLAAGDTAKSIRCTYAVDWSSVTSTYTGRIQVIWKVTVGGVVKTIIKVYDIVKQELVCPADETDLLDRQPWLQHKLAHQSALSRALRLGWEKVEQRLSNMGIRTNLIISDGDTNLRDATVWSALLVLAQAGHAPTHLQEDIGEWIEMLEHEVITSLGPIRQFVDEDEDGALESGEEDQSRMTPYFRM